MNSGYRLIYHKDATKYLARQERAIQNRVARALSGLLEIPLCGDIEAMKGEPGKFRLKIGDLRVLFRIGKGEMVIYIEAIGPRGDVYKK